MHQQSTKNRHNISQSPLTNCIFISSLFLSLSNSLFSSFPLITKKRSSSMNSSIVHFFFSLSVALPFRMCALSTRNKSNYFNEHLQNVLCLFCELDLILNSKIKKNKIKANNINSIANETRFVYERIRIQCKRVRKKETKIKNYHFENKKTKEMNINR